MTVDEFVRNLHVVIRNHYKSKYAFINSTLDEETQIHSYKWLKEVEAITDAEYEELLQNFRIKKFAQLATLLPTVNK